MLRWGLVCKYNAFGDCNRGLAAFLQKTVNKQADRLPHFPHGDTKFVRKGHKSNPVGKILHILHF
jgi:hypothetical protein